MLAVRTSSIGRGFSEPVSDAQKSFRTLLSAMSEPGTIHSVDADIEAPAGLTPAAAIVLLTLADQETPVWFGDGINQATAAYIRFHCSAPIAANPLDGVLVALDGTKSGEPLSAFNAGIDQFPDRSATVIVQCARLWGGPAVALSGPGIPATRTISPAGLHPTFWSEVRANNAMYPLGVDVLLVADRQIMAIPRSTAISDDGGR